MIAAAVKLCECGCGEPAPVAARTCRGRIAGQPIRFIHGHHLRLLPRSDMHVLSRLGVEARRRLQEPVEVRFWRKVQKTETCWLFMGRLNEDGYGVFSVNRRSKHAHRVSFELTYGPLSSGLFACHHCDVRPCVRPDHLFKGTAADNTADMIQKGRQRWCVGETNGQSKLSAATVEEIRRLVAAGQARQVDIVRDFRLSPAHVHRLIYGKAWKAVA